MDTRNDCCRRPDNLELVDDPQLTEQALRPDSQRARPDLQVRRCKACGRRHFELTVDPGRLGLSLR